MTSSGQQRERYIYKDIESEGMKSKLERGLTFLDTVSVINEDDQEYIERRPTQT